MPPSHIDISVNHIVNGCWEASGAGEGAWLGPLVVQDGDPFLELSLQMSDSGLGWVDWVEVDFLGGAMYRDWEQIGRAHV